jgi:Phage portal protein
MSRVGTALRHAWNVFSNQEQRTTQWPPVPTTEYYGASYGLRPDRVRLRVPNERSIITSIYTRLSIDVASVDMRHVRLDDQKRYLEDIDSGLNNCLTVEANLDQAARALRQDIALTMFDEGVAVVVPVDTSISPEQSGGFDILTLRVGKIVAWYPRHVRISLYNEAVAQRQEITLQKSAVAIVENPLFSVMNEPNSTLQRLLHKLNLLDAIDEQSASGKLDLIIQLPYVIKSEARRQQAEQRRTDIEFQLKGSQYGIAYTDGTEKITQLNRPAENNLMSQIEFLTAMLYGQLGLTEEVMNGTADEKAMLNYWNRTIEPVLTAMAEEMRRKFLTKTARTQKQDILFFRDPFTLVPIENIAEIADKFTRNEIMTSNEMRQVVGMKPHPDPKADQLINSNMPQGSPTPTGVTTEEAPVEVATEEVSGMPELIQDFDEIDGLVEEALAMSGMNGNGDHATF